MSRVLPAAMAALAVFASPVIGSFQSSVEPAVFDQTVTRGLAIAANGYGQVGQTLFGVVDSAGTTTTSNVEFGSNVAMSANGLRLAVSARRHDWVSEDNSGTLNEDGGAVFIYDYVGLSWVYKTHFVGEPGEELGRWPISLSADGQTIAIRRGTATQPAEVWQVDAAGIKTQLGSAITCTDAGSMVALTETSSGTTRIAVACEFDGTDANSGLTKVLDYNGTDWVELAGSPLSVDPTGVTDGLFGFDMAWALNGTRLALSSPNYGDTFVEQGLVQVYDFDDGTWTQLGANLTGEQGNEKFGFTIGISADGETLVVGSPNKDFGVDDNKGAVRIYTLQTGTTWQFEQEIEGSQPGDVFGRGISVSSDGNIFSASSSAHNGDRGQVRVFELSGGTWNSIAEFEGNNAGDLLGFNNMGVTMTPNGERLAMAAIHAQTNGIVQVFDNTFTPAPSAAPSLAPSASAAPTHIVIAEDGMDDIQFSWDLEALPDLTEIAFSEDADTSEIILHYNISTRETKIQAFETDCTTPIPANVTVLTSEYEATSATHSNFSVAIDIQQDNVLESSIWSDVGVGQGLISLCVRVDLLLGDLAKTSVTFHETIMDVSIGLLQGFEITGIDLERTNATETAGSTDLDYNVTACHCNAAGSCVNDVLSQGSDVYLCVETTAPNVEFVAIQELTMVQGSFNTTPIVAGIEDPLTEVTIDGKEATIRYQIISAFFSDPDPLDIVATGAALLAFADDDGRRFLRSASVGVVGVEQRVRRESALQDEELFDRGWSVQMAVESAASESSGAFAYGWVGGFSSLIVAVTVGAVGSVMVF